MFLKRIRAFIFLSIFMLICGYAVVNEHKIHAVKHENKGLKKDQEIIENLDFLDSLDLFREDLVFLENYDGINQSELIGESNE